VERQRQEPLDAVVLSFRPPDPATLNRILRDSRGRVRGIARAAAVKGARLVEASAGIYCFRRSALEAALSGLRVNRVSGELELADTVEKLARRSGRVEAIGIDWREAWIIQTRRDLAAAEEIIHRRGIERALDSGVTLLDPSTTRIGPDVALEPDTVVHPFVILEGKTTVSSGCEIFSFTRVADSRIAPLAVIGPHCDIEGARIGERARIGPFARLRPGTVLEQDVRVGNFVETKEALLKQGVKALHLSYLGDTEIGAAANIGAGVITCNYDGRVKNRTVVGAGAFVGSDTQLVAPVTVGEGAYIGAGSTITEDVPAGALSLSRVPQKNKEGWVAKKRASYEGQPAAEKGR
jgi:bifunctional UDP-N-acetylglucosamine pyrophosphorylase/glucosamine-1-phosphate N-acetyltransferase